MYGEPSCCSVARARLFSHQILPYGVKFERFHRPRRNVAACAPNAYKNRHWYFFSFFSLLTLNFMPTLLKKINQPLQFISSSQLVLVVLLITIFFFIFWIKYKITNVFQFNSSFIFESFKSHPYSFYYYFF